MVRGAPRLGFDVGSVAPEPLTLSLSQGEGTS